LEENRIELNLKWPKDRKVAEDIIKEELGLIEYNIQYSWGCIQYPAIYLLKTLSKKYNINFTID